MYIRRGKRGELLVEQESKSSTSRGFVITNLNNTHWEPHVVVNAEKEEKPEDPKVVRRANSNGSNGHRKSKATRGKHPKAIETLKSLGPGLHPVIQIVEVSGLTRSTVYNQLTRHANEVERIGDKWQIKSE